MHPGALRQTNSTMKTGGPSVASRGEFAGDRSFGHTERWLAYSVVGNTTRVVVKRESSKEVPRGAWAAPTYMIKHCRFVSWLRGIGNNEKCYKETAFFSLLHDNRDRIYPRSLGYKTLPQDFGVVSFGNRRSDPRRREFRTGYSYKPFQ